MCSPLKRLATRPPLLGALAVNGPLTLLFQLCVPEQLTRALGYRGESAVFALDAHPYSPQATYERLAAYGQAGRRARIVMHLLFDLLYPVAYTLFFSNSFLLLSRHSRLVPWLWRWAALLPWVAAGSDLVENAAIISMAQSSPTPRPLLARLRAWRPSSSGASFSPVSCSGWQGSSPGWLADP
jgi:hypothetical protein